LLSSGQRRPQASRRGSALTQVKERRETIMSKKKLLTAVLIIAIAVALTVPAAMAAEVVQGKCVAIDEENKTYTIEIYDTTKDEKNPYGKSTNKTMVVNYSKALVGKDPEVGNLIRVAYKVEKTENIAIRIMNITKQDVMKKG
jgi:hypothetical protein